MHDEGSGGPVRVGLIGHGRIGARLARLMAETPRLTRLVAVLVRPGQTSDPDGAEGSPAICMDLAAFLAASPQVAVECASATALRCHGVAALEAGVDLIPLSLAALTDRAFEDQLIGAARRGPGRLEIPAGAMGSIDFLAAARLDALHRVSFRASYPPARWRGTPAETLIDLDHLAGPTPFLTASVREAAALFPRHINVAVGVALAGLGLDRTEARLIADPALRQARFEIEAEAGPGPVRLTVDGRDADIGADPIDYTTFSVLRLLQRRATRIAI